MIESFDDLDFKNALKPEEIEGPVQPLSPEEEWKQTLAKMDAVIQEKLGVSFEMFKQALSDYTVSHAEELTHEFTNIAPLGDYSKLLEDNDSMAEFLKTEAHKPEHWYLVGVREPDEKHKNLITFSFGNRAVDDGENFEGFVYVSFQGKIRHAFTQGS